MSHDQVLTALPAVHDSPEPPSTGVRRILIVDDDPLQRRALTRRLDALGIAADQAGDTAAAIAQLGDTDYDAVLLDLSLGEQDGIGLLQAVRDSHGDPAVIIISGLEDRVRSASFRLAEAIGVRMGGSLRKPIRQDALRGLLDTLPARAGRVATPRSAPKVSVEDLTRAVEQGRIGVRFQPKVSLRDGHVVGVEALARWPEDSPVAVSPDTFIPLAEANGLIIPLTFHVLARALAACRTWRTRHPDCTVAVNISPLVLADPGLPEAIETMLREAGLGAGALVAEITESTVIEHPLVAAEVLTRLRIKGVSLAIDDFGTGHSSLLSLLRLPFSELKIDKSFVQHCDVDPEAWKITRATISMARELGLAIVAEGVETEEVAARLRSAGCDAAQGWLFAKAMDIPDLEAWLDRQPTPAA